MSLPKQACCIFGILSSLAIGSSMVQAQCAGDCNQDRQATVEEIVTLVNIALGITVASQCPAGDTSGDDAVTVDELQAAINVALSGCPEQTGLRIDLGNGSGAAGEEVAIEASLAGAGDQIVATSNDISYDATVLTLGRNGERLDCTIAPRLGPGSAPDKMLLVSLLPSGEDVEILRVGIFGINHELISDGPLFSCRFTIDANAAPQTVTLRNQPGASNPNGRQFENRTCTADQTPLTCCTASGAGNCEVGGAEGRIVVSR